MNFAIAGIVGWLLILAAAMALANAAQRGDELAEAARRNRPDSARSADHPVRSGRAVELRPELPVLSTTK